MNREKTISVLEYGTGFFLLGLFLLFQYKRAFTYEERFLFVELILAYYWVSGLFMLAKARFGLSILEPLSIITGIYMGVFIFKPLMDLRADRMYEHGIAVIEGGPKATLLFVLGFTVMFFAYFLERKTWTFNGKPLLGLIKGRGSRAILQNRGFLIGAWSVVYVLCVIGMMSQGLSLRYIFSFGFEGERVVDDSNTALLFLSNFGITLVTFWTLILDRVRSKWVKIITTALCAVYILMRNARWLMLVFILAPLTLYYLKKRKQPRVRRVALVFLAALVVFSWMQVNRNVLHSGGAMQGWGREGITPEVLLKPIDSDFSTYKSFYAMMLRYPGEHDYLYGTTFAYIFVLFIPKSIWAGKPDNPIRDMIEIALNNKARRSGTAVANIGELYANFGVVGILLGMLVLGRLTAGLKDCMVYDGVNDDGLIFYSIMFPLLFQWIARGNFSGNVYLTVFAVLPFIIAAVYENLHRRKTV